MPDAILLKDKRVAIERNPDEMVIRYRLTSGAGFLGVGGLMFVALMPLVGIRGLNQDEIITYFRFLAPVWSFLLFGLAVFAYFLIAGDLDSLVITADLSTLRVAYEPLPLTRAARYDVRGIKQFLSEPGLAESNYGRVAFLDSECRIHYFARTTWPETTRLQIAHELQDFYGLKDEPVFGITDQLHVPGPVTEEPL